MSDILHSKIGQIIGPVICNNNFNSMKPKDHAIQSGEYDSKSATTKPATSAHQPRGRNHKGSYKLVRLIGLGTFAGVYLAKSLRYGTQVAVKALHKADLSPTQLEIQRKEIEIHSKLTFASKSDSKLIINYIGSAEDNDFLYLVMDYFPGGMDLYEATLKSGDEGLSDAWTKQIWRQLLAAVQFCHENSVYHRDLKPENVLVNMQTGSVRLCDFGLASTDPVSSDFRVGSFPYMSPEAYNHQDRRSSYELVPSDIWALGVILINIRFGMNLWKKPCKEIDFVYKSFVEDPKSLQSNLNLSAPAMVMISAIFNEDPKKRPSIPQLIKMLDNIKSFMETDEYYSRSHYFQPPSQYSSVPMPGPFAANISRITCGNQLQIVPNKSSLLKSPASQYRTGSNSFSTSHSEISWADLDQFEMDYSEPFFLFPYDSTIDNGTFVPEETFDKKRNGKLQSLTEIEDSESQNILTLMDSSFQNILKIRDSKCPFPS